jgi:protoporphyrin/coproporphyrin ferrochelatase
MKYIGTEYDHRSELIPGILLLNLGTPDAPTPEALRPYLRQFLGDTRVIEVPRAIWWFVLNFAVLPFRPKRSAKLYQNIWTAEGSPLQVTTRKQRDLVLSAVREHFGCAIAVEYGMRYGNPSVASALEKLKQQQVDRLLVLPLFPQYSGTTTASAFDAVFTEMLKWRLIPELRFVRSYHDHPAFIDAVARRVEAAWAAEGRGQKLIISFHGTPKSYLLNGDPYFCHCHKTGRLVAERLRLKEREFLISFQSLFGKDEWLRPYTDQTLIRLAQEGVSHLDVVCPGFTSDCLETIDEIDRDYREQFIEHGGKKFTYIPAVNDSARFIEALVEIAEEHMGGWIQQPQTAGRTETFARYSRVAN